jgi:ABC-type phosphate transport system substrate-binding protein
MKARQILAGFAGLLLAAGVAADADAQTIINGAGASAVTPFMTEVPLSLCDASPLPEHYVNGPLGTPTITTGRLHVWKCNRSGNPIIIRYHASGSSAGVLKLQNPEAAPQSQELYLDHTVLTGCVGPTLKTRPSDGKQYNEYLSCTGGLLTLPVNIGASDVHGSSFHQVGPITTSVVPLDQSMLTSTQVAVVPFAIILGGGVYEVDPSGNIVGQVQNLSRPQVEMIFSRQVTDWRQLGLGTGPLGAAPGTPADATSPITLCMRTAGSGTKAAFDETTMKDANETPSGSSNLTNPADGAYFGISNQDVRDCIIGNAAAGRPPHIRAAGYMEADQAQVAVDTVTTGPQPDAYIVRMNGYLAKDPTHPSGDSKHDLKCGKFLYWVGERLNTRNPSSADPATQTLIADFINVALTPSTIDILPAGQFWEAPTRMNVSKNADAGPKAAKSLPLPFNGCIN